MQNIGATFFLKNIYMGRNSLPIKHTANAYMVRKKVYLVLASSVLRLSRLSSSKAILAALASLSSAVAVCTARSANAKQVG